MVNRVLVDASTALFASQLLTTETVLNVVNLLDLAGLIDSVVLSEHVTLLDTSSRGVATEYGLQTMLGTFADGIFEVRRATTDEIFASLARHRAKDGWTIIPFDDLFIDLPRIQGSYLSWLQSIYDHYWPPNRPGQRVPSAVTGSYLMDMARWIRENRVLPPTLFNEWFRSGGAEFSRLAVAGVLRCQVYLAAAEVYHLPYKPDALRWPLVSELLGVKDVHEQFFGQALVALAEKSQAQQAYAVGDLLGVRVVAPMPLLLSYVLKKARTRDEIISVCMEIRESAAARRFREFTTEIASLLAKTDYSSAHRELNEYAAAISRMLGAPDRPDALYAILDTASDAAKVVASPSIDGILKSAASSGRLLDQITERRRARRFALITAPLKIHMSLADLQKDLQRLFGRQLSQDELALVAKTRHKPIET